MSQTAAAVAIASDLASVARKVTRGSTANTAAAITAISRVARLRTSR